MSESDEPSKTRKRRKRARRSLRVPVDEVPRPTQAAGEGSSTTEMEVFDDEDERRVTLDDRRPIGARTLTDADAAPLEELDSAHLEEIDPALLDESFVTAPHAAQPAPAREEVEEAAPPAEDDDALLGAPREDAHEEELAPEATVVQEPPSELEEAAAKEPVEAQAEEPAQEQPAAELREELRSVEVVLDSSHGEEADDEPSLSAEEGSDDDDEDFDESPAPEAPKVPSVGVVVQRVVAIVSAPGSVPLPPLEPEPEPPAEEELDVDVEDEPRRDSTPELLAEEAADLLEEEEAPKSDAGGAPRKRISRPPPPPPKGKEAPVAAPAPKEAAPPPKEPVREARETPREPFSAASREAAKPPGKKPRRNWWEELFNDDYLRTVPIPHPKVIARQCEFIEQRLGLGHGATVLDVGCGLGLHAVELTRRGYLVVGLDLSLPMLSRAADEAQDHGFKINFLHADMREMNFDGAFDAVLCWGTTLGYFDDETNKQVVERLYRALKPRGLLLLEVANRDFVIRNQPNLVWFEGDGCVVMEESAMNYITSRLDVKRTVILDDGRQRDNLYSIRLYSLHELGQILHHQGFRVVEVTGLEAHPAVFFGADSPKLIILAERRLGPIASSRAPSVEMPAVTDSGSSPGAEKAAEPSKEAEEEGPEAAPEGPPSSDVSAALAETLAESEERAALDEAPELDPSELTDEDEK